MQRITLHRIPLDSFFALFDGFDEPDYGPVTRGWSSEDEAMLTRLWLQDVHITDICRVLGNRTRRVVYNRKYLLHLPPRTGGRREPIKHIRLDRTTLASLHQELHRAM